MRHLKTTTFAALFIALLAPSLAFAAPPAILPVQGYITDSADIPIDGARNVKFELFTASTSGTSLYSSTIVGLTISEGYFTAYLGDTPQPVLDLTKFRDQDIIWLEISVGAETMAPRLQVGSVGFAAAAKYCGDAATVGGSAVSDLQSRVTGTCASNKKMVGINADGTVMCQDDIDTTTTYTLAANSGLVLTGTVLSMDTTGCLGGESLKRNPGNTGWECSVDISADSLCAAGQYLDGDGSCKAVLDTTAELTPLLDASYVNVNEANSVNSAMIAADTIVAADIATDAVGTAEIAAGAVGPAKIAAGAVGASKVDKAEVQLRVDGVCATGWKMMSVNDDGTVNCDKDIDTDTDTDTQYSAAAGGGLVQVGTAFSLDTTGCAAGEVLKRNPGNTGWVCVIDDNAVYTNGSGLSLTAGVFAIATGGVTSTHILDGTIASIDIADNSVAGADILDGTVASLDIADNSVQGSDILDGTIASADIGDGTIVGLDVAANTLGPREVNLPTTSGASNIASLVSGTYSYGVAGVVIPAGGANCMIWATSRLFATITTGLSYIYPAYYNGAVDNYVGTGGGHFLAGSPGSGVLLANNMGQVVLPAGTYSFGCYFYGYGDFLGKAPSCQVMVQCN